MNRFAVLLLLFSALFLTRLDNGYAQTTQQGNAVIQSKSTVTLQSNNTPTNIEPQEGVNNNIQAMYSEGFTMPFNYNELSEDVKQQIAENKANHLPVLYNIAKSYKVNIHTCHSDSDCKNKFSFLEQDIGFIKLEFLESDWVNLIVSTDYQSEKLKDRLKIAGFHFDFINEKLVLNQK